MALMDPPLIEPDGQHKGVFAYAWRSPDARYTIFSIYMETQELHRRALIGGYRPIELYTYYIRRDVTKLTGAFRIFIL
jgi:hypothetical protein